MKDVAIFGSTGSIGRQALDVVEAHPDLFRVTALSAGSNAALLAEQCARHKPEFVSIADESGAAELSGILPAGTSLLSGPEAAASLAAEAGFEICLNAVVGFAGLAVTLAAARPGRRLALANKESLVAAGELVLATVRAAGAEIIPVDSEHSAIYQCLIGEDREGLERILLTASGGPFRGKERSEMESATVDDVLAHPTWQMGSRITVDCATMMNKGFEVIEACHLFGVELDRVEVLVHPQSIVHSMVEFRDRSVIGHLGRTDMRIPIQFALTCPQRIEAPVAPLDLTGIAGLTFEQPDEASFPCLEMAREAFRRGAGAPAAVNAADERAVAAFLSGRIRFTDIAAVVGEVLEDWQPTATRSLDDVTAADAEARRRADEAIAGMEAAR